MDRVKLYSGKVAKGALLALGLPYAVVILANCLYGWPCSQEGEDRYKRALQPARVLKVTYAVAEQLTLVNFLPVYIRWTSHYRTASNVVKDILYGVNENKLDVWTSRASKEHSAGGLYTQLSQESHSLPVVVFVYGGAWGSGDKNMYGLLAQEIIDHLGAVVVVPNYAIHPKGDVNAMLQDLRDTLAYIRSPDFHQLAPNADPQKVLLFGHSAGAHLCALSAIDLAQRVDEQMEAAKSEDENLPRVMLEENVGENLETGHHQNRTPSAAELLSSVRGVLGLGGVYHIMDHYHHEARRGVEDLSFMWQAMNGMGNFDAFSPTERVAEMSRDQIERLPPFYLIHGTEDIVVPPASTDKFAAALAEKEANVSIKMVAEGGHAQLIIDMMDRGRHFHDPLINLLVEFWGKVSRD